MRNNTRRYLITGTAILTAGLFSPAYAQLQSLERKDGTGAVAADPKPRVVTPAPSAREPDPSGVWYHVRRNDFGSARKELDRLTSENPGWRVPDDLAAAINPPAATRQQAAEDTYNRQINAAEAAIRAGKTPRDLRALVRPLQRRKDSGAAERIGQALLETNAPKPALDWFERARDWAAKGSVQETAAIIGLVKTQAVLLEWEDAAKVIAKLPPGEARTQSAQILADAATVAAEKSARGGDWATAERLAKLAETHAQAGSLVRANLGWAALDTNDANRAAGLFAAGPQSEDTRFGRILALSRIPGDSTQLAAACAPQDRSQRQSEACADAFAARALDAYNEKQWPTVIALDGTAEKLGVARSGTRLLTGWSHYRQNEYAQALTAFDQAAVTEPDAVEGSVTALIALRRYDELAARAAAGDAKFNQAYSAQIVPLAVARKHLLYARKMGLSDSDGMDAPTFTVAAFGRDKTGAKGADRMTWQAVSVSASFVSGSNKFSGGVERGYMRVGTPEPFAPIGTTFPGVFQNRNTTLTTPWLRWDSEGLDSTYTVAVGTTPIGGEINALPIGAISVGHDWDRFITTVGIKAAPRADSLLAMSGLRDPATGVIWGRVVEIGPSVGVVGLLTDQLSFSANASAGALRGDGVAHNTHIAGSLSLTYEFKANGFDYIRLGPSYSFDHYQTNQNFFTLGNGGYYSPDQAHSAGAFIDFLTTEGKSWQLAGRVTGAWQHSVEEAGIRFPLDDTGGRFPAQTQSQFGTDSTVRGAFLVAANVILGAYGRVTYAPSGRDLAAGLSLTVPWSRRAAVFSSDLPRFADRSWP